MKLKQHRIPAVIPFSLLKWCSLVCTVIRNGGESIKANVSQHFRCDFFYADTHAIFILGPGINLYCTLIEIAHGSLHRIFSNFIWLCHFDRCHGIHYISNSTIATWSACKITLAELFSLNCNAKYTHKLHQTHSSAFFAFSRQLCLSRGANRY